MKTLKRNNIILHYTVKIKFLKVVLLISEILSPGKLDDQRKIIMNINSMLQKEIKSELGVSSITSLTQKIVW